MVRIVASIDICGLRFSPAKSSSELGDIFNNAIEVGEIGKIGRYKGKQMPYGSATIKPPKYVKESERILWLTSYLNKNFDTIRKNGGDDISISVGYFYKGQCNCELSHEELKGLALLGIPFLFSVYEVESLDDLE